MQDIKKESKRYDDITEKVKIFWENDGFMPGAEASKELPTDYLKLGIFLSATINNMMEDLEITPETAHENGHFLLAVSSVIAKTIDEAVKYEKVSA